LAVSTQSPKTSTSTEAIVDDATPALNLITAKSINTAVDNNQTSIMLASGGKVTPLARDLAKEYDIKIIEI